MADVTGVKQTCPSIDKVISQVKEAVRYLKSEQKGNDSSDIHWALYALDDIEDYMEEIRSANSTLRDFAIRKAKELEEIES